MKPSVGPEAMKDPLKAGSRWDWCNNTHYNPKGTGEVLLTVFYLCRRGRNRGEEKTRVTDGPGVSGTSF